MCKISDLNVQLQVLVLLHVGEVIELCPLGHYVVDRGFARRFSCEGFVDILQVIQRLGFRYPRNLNAFGEHHLPVDVPEKCVGLDFFNSCGSTPQSLAWLNGVNRPELTSFSSNPSIIVLATGENIGIIGMGSSVIIFKRWLFDLPLTLNGLMPLSIS